jgi:AP-3 complex subunit mu
VTETLDFVLDKHGKVVTGGVSGEVGCRSRLSGMPDLVLSFTDPSQLEDVAFHPSVRNGRWTKEKLISFVPREFSFLYLSFNTH